MPKRWWSCSSARRAGASRRTGRRSISDAAAGVWGVPLAKRGWQVTSVDIVEKALERARERVEGAGVDVRVVHGDVTDLRNADVGSGFRLVLDTGTFHGLADDQREAMGREVSAIAADDATVLLDVFAPRRRRTAAARGPAEATSRRPSPDGR